MTATVTDIRSRRALTYVATCLECDTKRYWPAKDKAHVWAIGHTYAYGHTVTVHQMMLRGRIIR